MGIETFNKDFDKSFNMDIGFRSGASDYSKGNGFNIEMAYRKYVSPMSLRERKHREFFQGIYYSMFLRGSQFTGYFYDYDYSNPTSPEKQTVNSIAPGFTLGLQKTLWQIIYLDIYFGGGIKFSDDPRYDGANTYNTPDITDPGYQGIFPKIGAKIGVGL